MLQKVFKISELEIPMIGMGTRALIGQPCRKLISSGLYLGYKHIDTNPGFKNEQMIAAALKKTSREEYFITSKIQAKHLDFNSTVHSVETTLKNMGLEYLDLVLLDSPGRAEVPGKSRMNSTYRHKAWRALIQSKNRGLIKNIGVANFLPSHIEDLWGKYEFNPVANQFEFNPFCFDQEVYNFHKEKNIQIIASIPLVRCKQDLWKTAILVQTKKKYKVSKAQVLLKWGLQKGAAVIPKTKDAKRLSINSSLDFEISEEDMALLDSLSSGIRLGTGSFSIK